ncbi:hypothetical protein GSI_01801 [Ganoderma sinense ZZ0214-1]|uniref:Uncharacterized protein n=1 Tax=Ganoderma sinense ZZ0214-1 TaxID=1077348 RepID=A0A2G8SQU3_9APHY|nr:hypothetical protein GSI_01801 [Ganoderma sinense ZZ0214-1]
MSLASLPLTIWHLYVDNLVFYNGGSWVHSIASTFRFLAFATIVPFILLTLLDVASYIIARTLGVIDETKASTSGEHVAGLHAHPNNPNRDVRPPAIVVHDSAEDADMTALAAATPLPDDGEHGNLKLSGVDTFSPAPSQPGSPTLQRHEFAQLQTAHWEPDSVTSSASLSMSSLYGRDSIRGRGTRGGGRDGEEEGHYGSEKLRRAAGDGDGDGVDGTGEGALVGGPGEHEHEHEHGAASPRGLSGHVSAGSSSGDESYAILDRDSGSGTEDAGLVLRKRTRQGGTGADAE